MKLLGIDTSSEFLGLAIIEEGEVKLSLLNKIDRAHASILIPRIDEMLGLSGCSLDTIDGFVIDIGPGSFTGLRIGVSTVKGFLAGQKKGIKLVKSLDVIAANLNRTNLDICVVMDARRNNLYYSLFRSIDGNLKQISKYSLIKSDKLISKIKRPTIFTGDGLLVIEKLLKSKLGRLAHFASREFWHPKPEVLTTIGYKRIKKEGFDSQKDLQPFYIYPKECNVTLPKKK